MATIKVNLKENSYPVIVGSNILDSLGGHIKKLNIGLDAYIITNAAIKKKYGNILNKSLRKSGFNVKFKNVPDTEKSKSIEILSQVIKDIALYDYRRRIFIIAFGGGVIGDLAGFAASIYKRGVAYVQIPTTLLAQVDSSIGGKTAVDLSQGKNLIGTFYQPRLVVSEIKTLKTLELRQLRSGLAEVIKYAVIKDPRLFAYLEKNYRNILFLKKGSALEFIVTRCAGIKAKIVGEDEKDKKGIRTILNFGHTIGHAIEAASDYKKYNHGEAVALGMILACRISQKLGFINACLASRIENLIEKVGLPVNIKKISLRAIINAHYRDKKFIGAQNRFVLLKDIGKVKIVKNIPLKLIKEVLKERS